MKSYKSDKQAAVTLVSLPRGLVQYWREVISEKCDSVNVMVTW